MFKFSYFIAIIAIESLQLSAYNVNIDNIIIYNDTDLTKTTNDSNYFGYSVVFITNKRLQIGAPNNKQGVVYRCKFKESCNELELSLDRQDLKVNTDEKAWIGSAMDVDLNTSRSVICGSHFTFIEKVKYEIPNFVNGICFFTINEQVFPVLPLVDFNRNSLYLYFRNHTIMKQANGLSGFSAHFPKKSQVPELLLGAPGILSGIGATILYRPQKPYKNKNNKLNTDVLFHNKIINHLWVEKKDENELDEYIGYQVSSGNFESTSQLLYVTSAPRAFNCRGQVGFMLFPNKTPDPYVMDKKQLFIHSIVGQNVGEYFGASLAVTDLNNDSLDDLIVGSPLYTTNMEEGRVYIYLGHSIQFGDRKFSIVLDGNVAGGRFGTAISTVGDIDGDGFSDFVVGAPYEDDHRGAIYVYNGNEEGCSRTPQKIRAIEINYSLKGFGISIAGPMNFENDQHEDLAVGSYLSGHVIVLRTCPVATFRAKLLTNMTTIKVKESKFHVQACIEYTGKNIPEYTTLRRYISTDTNRISCRKPLGFKTINLTRYSDNCEEFIFNVINNDANYMEPIFIAMKIEFKPTKNNKSIVWIGNKGPEGSDLFTNCLKLNGKNSKLTDKIDMSFQIECSKNTTCKSDINLNAIFLTNSEEIQNYIIGSKQPLTLKITIENKGDTAFYSKLYIKLPDQMNVVQQSCQRNEMTLECQLMNRFETNKIINWEFDIDVSNFDRLKTSKTNLTFEISITSKTFEDYSNEINSTLNLIKKVGIQINGKAEQETYSNTENQNINKSITFEHSYEVQNFGVSPLENILLNLFVPTQYSTKHGDDVTIAVLDNIYGYFAEKQFHCQVQNRSLFHDDVGLSNETKLISNSVSEDRIFMLNCFENLVKCSQIVCSIESLIYSNQIIKLNVKINLSMPLIQEKLMGNKKFIQYSTHIFTKIENIRGIQLLSNESMHFTTVTTTFSIGLSFKISIWIILSAALIGIIALLLVIFLLSKCGFFRREKKEKLEHLIQEKRRTMTEFQSFNYEETFDVPID